MKVFEMAPSTRLKPAQSISISPYCCNALIEKAMASASVSPLTMATAGSQASPR
jgi:hypothetical protein